MRAVAGPGSLAFLAVADTGEMAVAESAGADHRIERRRCVRGMIGAGIRLATAQPKESNPDRSDTLRDRHRRLGNEALFGIIGRHRPQIHPAGIALASELQRAIHQLGILRRQLPFANGRSLGKILLEPVGGRGLAGDERKEAGEEEVFHAVWPCLFASRAIEGHRELSMMMLDGPRWLSTALEKNLTSPSSPP